ncbi:sodium-independent anion transporter [Sulfuriferula sp. AH1]|uniref:SulP family inorganic anion transporter n=1 Tax=Sulfuriferula sp. AH1 TaxID=1985873 RepID=UPI000B3B9A55|nr:SulP family inorganic anion transporter [Sulfuriferula sp. AH1]ARU31193.1 sodium-independent anion transporter [Sulfuriferula sp. AH1]
MTDPDSPVNSFFHETQPGGLARWMPGLAVLRNYRLGWLSQDILAGLVLTAILFPVGMGYAVAAGLPAIYGLYATIIPLVAYAVFGPSRILVLGPDSALSALIAAAILPLAASSPDRIVLLAGMLAIMSGALCLLAGFIRFGFITELISKPIRYGYLNGIALTVLVGQLSKIFGFAVTGDGVLQQSHGLVLGLQHGLINWGAVAIGLGSLLVMLAFKHRLPKVPGILIAVVGATLLVWYFDLAAQLGIAVVGALPQGLPAFHVGGISMSEFNSLLPGAVAIAVVSFADLSVLSRTYALRGSYEVNSNQELIALGMANIATGLFQGFPVTSSSSRTPVAESAGARTQLAGIVGALCIALLLIYAPTLLQDLPYAALGAVVIFACFGLVEIAGLLHLYHLRRGEFTLSMACFFGVILLGVIQGIFIAVGLALLAFVWRAWRPYDAVLGRVDGMKGYHDISRHPEGRQIPGLVLFRWDAPLFFANAEIFREHVLLAVVNAPTPARWVVVVAEPVTDVDTTAADMLADLDQMLIQADIELCFAGMKGPVKDRLKHYGLFNKIGIESFFPTVGQAVSRYLAENKVEWDDWDD